MVTVEGPLLDRVAVRGALVAPIFRLPKLNCAGNTDKFVPLPVNFNTWGVALSLSFTTMVPNLVPVDVGRNETVIVQLAPAARPLPQLLV